MERVRSSYMEMQRAQTYQERYEVFLRKYGHDPRTFYPQTRVEAMKDLLLASANCGMAYTSPQSEMRIEEEYLIALRRYILYGAATHIGAAKLLSVGYEAENAVAFDGDTSWEDAASYLETLYGEGDETDV